MTNKERFAAGELSAEEYAMALEIDNERLAKKAANTAALRMKVSDKGGMSLYGLGRFPVTLYKEQWIRLMSFASEIVGFLKENEAAFSTKDNPKVKTAA